MASSKPNEEGSKQGDLVEGSAGTDVPKMTDAAAARGETELILKLIRAGDSQSLLKAFQTNPSTASDVIVALAESGQPEWTECASTLSSTLTTVLVSEMSLMVESQLEGRVGPEDLEQQALVRINLVKAMASISPEPCNKGKGIGLMLTEAAGLRREVRLAILATVVSSFELVDVVPSLLVFLQEANGHGREVLDDFLAIIPYVIDRGFAIYADKPVEAGFCRTLLFSLFVVLVNDERVDEWMKEKITRIIWTRAKPLAGGLRAALDGVARAPWLVVTPTVGRALATPAERTAWRICHDVLTSLESGQVERRQVADWVLGRSLYLPEEAQDPKMRETIQAASAQNIAGGHEEAAKETRQNHSD